MTDTLFKAELELVSTGLQPGVHPQAVPLWADGINIHFDKYGVHSAKGTEYVSSDTLLFDNKTGNFDDATGTFDSGGGAQQILSPATAPIRALGATLTQLRQQRLVFGTTDQLWVSEGQAPQSALGPLGGGFQDDVAARPATRWSIVPWGDWLIAADGVNPVYILKTLVGGFTAIIGSGVPGTAEILARLGAHVLAFYTNGVPNQFQWCEEGEPEQWDPAAGNHTAGSLLIRDMETEIRAVAPLGQGLAVYGANTIHLVSNFGAFIFGHEFGLKGVGALGKANIVSLGNVNYGLSSEGIFVTDGNTFRIVSYPKLGQWIREHVNLTQSSKIVGWHMPDLQQLRWSLPVDGSQEPNKTIAYNYATQEYTFLSGAITSVLERGVFKQAIAGNSGGRTYFLDTSNSAFDGSPVNRFVQTKPLHCGAVRNWKYLVHVLVQSVVTSGGPLKISIGWQERLSDPILWIGPFSLDELTEEQFTDLGFVYVSLRLETQGVDDDWTFTEIELDGQLAGRTF